MALRHVNRIYFISCYLVSIPYGFSMALRRYTFTNSGGINIGFNPLWVFYGAATCQFKKWNMCNNCRFNPLWVFYGAATVSWHAWNCHAFQVSIPYGFSMALRLVCAHEPMYPDKRVSIPYGFSMALRLPMPAPVPTVTTRFNPLWVFYGAATGIFLLSYQVFFVVSIPYGFSMALRPYDYCIASIAT